MEEIIYNGRKLPDALCVMIRRLSIRNVGLYDGVRHFFLTPKLDPTDAALVQIRKEYDAIDWLEPRDFNDVVNLVLDKTTVKPLELAPQTVSVGGKDGIPRLQHLIFREESGAETQLIYLGQREFYVLSTNRGTIMQGDILYANTLPFNVGEAEEFSIVRDNKAFVPDSIHYEGFELHKDYEVSFFELHKDYEVSFRFGKTQAIILEESPALYDIIDEDERFGGQIVRAEGAVKAKFISVLKKVRENVASLDPDTPLPDRAQYPGYDELLASAKQKGIGSYILNLLISTMEKRVGYKYAFVQEDWHVAMSPDMIRKLEGEEYRKKEADYRKLGNVLVAELKKIRTRRVGLFFKAPGRVENIEFVTGIINEMEALAEEGVGVKGQAQARLDEAIDNSRPAPRENLFTALKLAAAVIVIVVVAVLWVRTADGVEKYNIDAAAGTQLLSEGKYDEAREAYGAAYNAYKPRITVLFVASKHKRFIKSLESQIDTDVAEGIEQIKAFRAANRGRFDKTSEALLFRLLQLRPENEELMSLKEEWLQQ